jgi:hypothetical protein
MQTRLEIAIWGRANMKASVLNCQAGDDCRRGARPADQKKGMSHVRAITFAITVFFIDESGIRLSPAYDVNPSVDRQELTLAINELETACDVSIAMEASQDYGLNPREATNVLMQVQDAVGGWREEATRLNIPKAEQDLMATAFNLYPTSV